MPAEKIAYCLCPQCLRAVPVSTGERYCANDGRALLARCPDCHADITSPYARYCVACGLDFAHAGAQSTQASPPDPAAKEVQG